MDSTQQTEVQMCFEEDGLSHRRISFTAARIVIEQRNQGSSQTVETRGHLFQTRPEVTILSSVCGRFSCIKR